MPKSQQKYYAVKVGRGGPQIYNTWEECVQQVTRYPGNKFKSFRSRAEAQEWITPNPMPILPSNSGGPSTSSASESSAPSEPPSSQPEMPPVTGEPGVTLSPEQTHVLNMVKSGRNVFFTGSAGTGKSVLLRQIISWAKADQCDEDEPTVGVTASTGMAAVNIGGVTLHSWAGIGLGNEPADHYVKAIKYGPKKLHKRWRRAKTLIIDEVSMIDAGLFDKLEFIAREIRENERPFGGIQLVLSGDFFQLPPVDLGSKHVQFAFQAPSWDQCIDSVTSLTRVFRQKEQSFVELLNEMRFGKLSKQNKSRLIALSREVRYTDSVEPTQLFPTKREVQSSNESRLAKLTGPTHTFNAIDRPGIDDKGRDVSFQQAKVQLDRCVLAPESMTLKVGAQVMLIKNAEQGVLVNGSVGIVTDFLTCQEAKEIHHITVAISPKDREENQRTGEVRIVDRLWKNQTKWPVVEFPGGRKRLIPPHEFTIENASGSTQATRYQVPLLLAWAISIHKSQGQTLQRVRVDLGKIFEKGQAYVALSRATSLQTLQVLNFDPSRVMVHETVLNWHEQILERERKARILAECEQAINSYVDEDSDWENDDPF